MNKNELLILLAISAVALVALSAKKKAGQPVYIRVASPQYAGGFSDSPNDVYRRGIQFT